MLRLEDVHTYYGESHVLQGVDLEVGEGEVVCLLGRNGAGKTTTLRTIVGLVPPRRGRVLYRGTPIHGRRPYQITRMGLAYVPEDRRIFPGLTVEENLQIARRRAGGGARRWPIGRIYEQFPILADIRHRPGDYLSGGEQQMLSIARALVGEPELLLLDEPCEGLAPVIVQRIGALIDALAATTTILFTEQNVKFVLAHAGRGYIIEKGRIRHAATTAELHADSEVRERFLAV